jgi:hypothetical protein
LEIVSIFKINTKNLFFLNRKKIIYFLNIHLKKLKQKQFNLGEGRARVHPPPDRPVELDR